MNADELLPHPLRLFADNDRWWILNAGKEPLRDIEVSYDAATGPVAIDALHTAELTAGGQRCVDIADLADLAAAHVTVHASYQQADGTRSHVDRNL